MKKISLILILFWLFTGCVDERDELTGEWEYLLPNEEGANAYALLALDDKIKEGSLGDIHSLMMAKGQSVIFENYYHGHRKSELHYLQNATQSIFSMVLDTLLKEAGLKYTDHIIDLFPSRADLFDNIPQKDKITLRHLIQHKSGLWWTDVDLVQPNKVNDVAGMKNSDDWVNFVLSKRMIREPGLQYNFNSGHYILLSDILENRFDNRLEEKIDSLLFTTTGIHDWKWDSLSTGILNTVSGLQLSTEDMLKMGMVFMNDGKWKEDQILTQRWIGETKEVTYQDGYYKRTTGWLKYDVYHPAIQGNYDVESYFAWGQGGIYIVVLPQYEFVMAMTGSFQDNFEEYAIINILREYIFPSLKNKFKTT